MQFHYDRTLKQKVRAAAPTANASPAGLTIYLAKSLKEWLGQSCRVSYQDGKTQLQLGYETLSVPALEFAQAFAPLVCGVNPLWPVQIFGMADNGELIELSFAEKSGEYIVQQHNISGIWCENLQDIYVCIQFPDPLSAGCMYQLLWQRYMMRMSLLWIGDLLIFWSGSRCSRRIALCPTAMFR